MPFPHLKCPFGQVLNPCKPHGLQSKSETSWISESSESGPKPNCGTVEQKKAVTGAFIAEAICKGPESLTKVRLAFDISAADSNKFNSPAKFSAFGTPDSFSISAHNS